AGLQGAEVGRVLRCAAERRHRENPQERAAREILGRLRKARALMEGLLMRRLNRCSRPNAWIASALLVCLLTASAFAQATKTPSSGKRNNRLVIRNAMVVTATARRLRGRKTLSSKATASPRSSA